MEQGWIWEQFSDNIHKYSNMARAIQIYDWYKCIAGENHNKMKHDFAIHKRKLSGGVP